MAREGVEKLLGRLLGVKGLRVRGARFEPRGVVVDVRPPRRKPRCGVCGSQAVQVFDRFHVQKLANEALDEMRRKRVLAWETSS